MPFFCASPHRASAFSAGMVLGFCLVFVLSLPVLSAAFEISPPTPKAAPTPQEPPADPDDFIEGNYWALIIGIDKYPKMDKAKQLQVGRIDAEAVARLLVERYGFPKEHTVELYDEKATRKEIIEAFNSLKRRLADKDSLFIYYAGHGEYERADKGYERFQGMGYWIPSDAELDDPATYIFNSQIRDYVANIPARHIFLVVDSAYSGSLMGRTFPVPRGSPRELYQLRSRWIFLSGTIHPVPGRDGHSAFALNLIKILKDNNKRYLLASDLFSLPCNPSLMQLLPPCRGQVPRFSTVLVAGDEGGQFVFRLKKEFRK